jgi:membrane fusion protein, heavy metal efflux system
MRHFVIVIGIFMASCTERPEEADEHAHPRRPHDDHHEDHGAEDRLHVDRSMLRDLRITTAAAESRAAGETVTALGELKIDEATYAEVGSPISARVTKIAAAPGETVKVGQVLVELESAEVGRLRAALSSADARLELSKKTVERRRGLSAEQIVATRELETAEAELIAAEAEARSAKTALTAMGGLLGDGAKMILVAPVAGTVITREALRGQMVDAEHTLFVIGDLSRLWVVVHAFERDALRVRASGKARVSFPALPGTAYDAQVVRIGSRVDPGSRTIEVILAVDNPQGVLRPGMSAAAQLPLGIDTESVVTVPIAAVQRLSEGWSVFVPTEENGAFEVRAVGRGRDLGGEVEILSGLTSGEKVVVDGAFLLKAEADKARGGGADHHH